VRRKLDKPKPEVRLFYGSGEQPSPTPDGSGAQTGPYGLVVPYRGVIEDGVQAATARIDPPERGGREPVTSFQLLNTHAQANGEQVVLATLVKGLEARGTPEQDRWPLARRINKASQAEQRVRRRLLDRVAIFEAAGPTQEARYKAVADRADITPRQAQKEMALARKYGYLRDKVPGGPEEGKRHETGTGTTGKTPARHPTT
jgi:hypothetical protein